MLANAYAFDRGTDQVNLADSLFKMTAAKWHFNDLQLRVCLQGVLHASETKSPCTCLLLKASDRLWWKLRQKIYACYGISIVKNSVRNHLAIKNSWGMKIIKLWSCDRNGSKLLWMDFNVLEITMINSIRQQCTDISSILAESCSQLANELHTVFHKHVHVKGPNPQPLSDKTVAYILFLHFIINIIYFYV